MLNFHKGEVAAKNNRQASLFGALPLTATLRMEETAPLDTRVRLAWEKELLGLYLSAHPLHDIDPLLSRYMSSISNVKTMREGDQVRVCGVVSQCKKIITKKNESMLFARIEDLTDSLEVIVFPSLWRESMDLWCDETIVIVEGRVSLKDADSKLICSRARRVDDLLLQNLRSREQESTATFQALTF